MLSFTGMSKKQLLTTGLLCAFLAGCGGGDGDGGGYSNAGSGDGGGYSNTGDGGSDNSNSNITVAGAAQGVWEGTDTNGYQLDLVVLDNGATYGTYSSSFWDGATSMVYGNTSASGAILNGSMTKVTFFDGSRDTISYSGSVEPENTLSIAMNDNSGATYTGSYLTAYEHPISLEAIEGTYTGNAIIGSYNNGTNAVMTIDQTGNISVSVANYANCLGYGTVTPHNGTGIFDFNVTFGGDSDCPAPLAGGTVTGVAYPTAENGTWAGIQVDAVAPSGGILWFSGSL